MKIKPDSIKIEAENPFKEDVLNRKESVEILTQLISELNDSLVLAIDSPWGTGKTTFIEMWQRYLKNKGYPTLFFNAWKNDFNNDALIALIGEVGDAIDAYETDDSKLPKLKEYVNNLKSFGSVLIKNSVPIALKYASAGVLDLDDLSEKAIGEIAQNIAKDKINKYEETKNTIIQFKENLQKFTNEITKSENGDIKPLVFFIDELDRCRPPFALQILEKAKHLFNVENIIFVLALDKNQMGNSIKGIYGSDMDIDGYLRRFIDLNYYLPEPPKGAFVQAMFNRFEFDEYFKERTEFSSSFGYDKEQFISVFIELFSIFNFSLRVQEQCFTQVSIVFKTTPKDFKLFPILLATLIAIKNYNIELYRKYVHGEVGVETLKEELFCSKQGQAFLKGEGKYAEVVEAYLIYYDKTEERISIIKQYQDIKEKNNNSDIYYKADKIIRIIGKLDFERSSNVIEYLMKKIELLDRFQS